MSKGLTEMKASDGKLKRDDIIDKTFWFYYCCYEGTGFGRFSDPLCGMESKNLCMHTSCISNQPVMSETEGLCSCVEVSETDTSHFQCPPNPKAPKCVCLNCPLAGDFSQMDGKDPNQIFEYDKLFDGTWWYIYLLCCGMGHSGLQAGGRPLYARSSKCFCILSSSSVENNDWPGAGSGAKGWKKGICESGDEVCDAGFGKMCCIFTQKQIPPAPSAPCCKICNFPLPFGTTDEFCKKFPG